VLHIYIYIYIYIYDISRLRVNCTIRFYVITTAETIQAMHVHYIEARSRNHCCSGTEISITYSEGMCVLS